MRLPMTILAVVIMGFACWPLDLWHYFGAFLGVNILLLAPLAK
jgi:hypothetical protein